MSSIAARLAASATPTATTTYFARFENAGPCNSACVSTTVTVSAGPTAPTAANSNSTSYCTAKIGRAHV